MAKPSSQTAWILYYDGGCNLCHRSQLTLEKWAERAGQPLRAEVLQSPEAMDKGYNLEDMVLEADGKVYTRAGAWLRAMRIAPWYLRWAAWVCAIQPFKAIASWIYNGIAARRHRIWGRRACPIPPRDTSSKPSD